MITYFPPLYPDEAIYSIGFRVARDCNLSYYEMTREIFGGTNQPVIHPLISIDFNYLFSQLPNNYPYTLEKMIDEHTVLPAYKIGLFSENYSRIMQKIKTSIKYPSRSIIKSNEKNIGYRLKYCDMCIEEDKNQYGEAIFHRDHQFGGNIVCSKHGIPLKSIELKNKGSELIDINSIKNKDNMKTINRLSNKELEWGYKIAVKIKFLLQYHDFLSAEHTKQLYMNTLITQEHLEGGFFSRKEIQDKIREKYNSRFLNIIGCSGLLQHDGRVLSELYREKKMVIDPIKNIIFIEAILGEKFELILSSNKNKFIDELLKDDVIKQKEYLIYSKEKSLKSKIKELYRFRIDSLKNKKTNYGRKSIMEDLRSEYIWLYFNDRKWINQNLPISFYSDETLVFNVRQKKYRERLIKELDISDKNLLTTLHDNMNSAYKWLRENDKEWLDEQLKFLENSKENRKSKYRKDLIEFMKLYPDSSRFRISRTMMKEYDWLLNNDLEWLETNLPDKRVNLTLSHEERREKYRQIVIDILQEGPGLSKSYIRSKNIYGYKWLQKHDRKWFDDIFLKYKNNEI